MSREQMFFRALMLLSVVFAAGYVMGRASAMYA
jgi:lipopolysaccharide biosynthesis regulator YciM